MRALECAIIFQKWPCFTNFRHPPALADPPCTCMIVQCAVVFSDMYPRTGLVFFPILEISSEIYLPMILTIGQCAPAL